ncbi:hypothetical protein WR25_06566 [Diploscapter pachys]|uniref:Uncharacterized protein n=1 Tax=Diploscapter pachys TaxID=2018661 RepID=A0A2A2L069_9BILA|nr:hypothetical protein WR25_06566 [Diploscapter pachys]
MTAGCMFNNCGKRRQQLERSKMEREREDDSIGQWPCYMLRQMLGNHLLAIYDRNIEFQNGALTNHQPFDKESFCQIANPSHAVWIPLFVLPPVDNQPQLAFAFIQFTSLHILIHICLTASLSAASIQASGRHNYACASLPHSPLLHCNAMHFKRAQR